MSFRKIPGGSLIRRGQRGLTNLSPHQGNPNYLVAGRGAGAGPIPPGPPSAAEFRGSSGAAGVSGVTVINLFAEIGDLVLCHVAGRGTDLNPDPLPAGAVLIDSIRSEGSLPGRATVGWLFHDGRADYFFPDAGQFTIAAITVWRGVDPVNPIDSVAKGFSGNNTTHSASVAITTSSDLSTVVGTLALGDTGSTLANLTAGWSAASSNTAGSNTGRLYVARKDVALPAGPVGAAIVQSSAAAEECTVSVSIRGLNT